MLFLKVLLSAFALSMHNVPVMAEESRFSMILLSCSPKGNDLLMRSEIRLLGGISLLLGLALLLLILYVISWLVAPQIWSLFTLALP